MTVSFTRGFWQVLMKSRIEQRDDLIYSLGLLVDPIRRLLDDPQANRIPWIRSQFLSDLESGFLPKVAEFCRTATHQFATEAVEIRSRAYLFTRVLEMFQRGDTDNALQHFEQFIGELKSMIRGVPCEDPDTIFPANSPFQTHLRLRAICSTTGSRVDVFDPYLDASVFHLYLAEVSESVPIVVVTSEGNMATNGKKLARRRRELVAVSQLFAAERPVTYRFLVAAGLHDRHLRADSTIYHLGGSLKDAAAKSPFTLSKHTPTETEVSLNGIIAQAVEWFGPRTPKHRRR